MRGVKGSTTLMGILAAVATLMQPACSAQTLAPYSAFQGMSEAELQNLQGKLTLLGARRGGGVKTLVWRASGHTPDLSVFQPYYRTGQFTPGSYNSDYHAFDSFSASPEQLKAMIDSVAVLVDVTDGDVDSSGFVSFALSNVIDGSTYVFESVVNPETGRQLFGRLLGAFADNDSALSMLEEEACVVGMTPGPTPIDVTGAVSIEVRGYRKDRSTGHYIGQVRVTNDSTGTIQAPILLALGIPTNVVAVGASGATCALQPSRWPYFELAVGSGLAPGAHVDLSVEFENPDDEVIQLDERRVFAGEGYR